MRLAVRIGVALAAFPCVAAAPAGRAGSSLQVGATVIRPAAVETIGGSHGAVRVASAGGVNVTAAGARIVRRGGEVLVFLPAASAAPLLVTIEY